MSWPFELNTSKVWAYRDNVFSNTECDKIIQIASQFKTKSAETERIQADKNYRISTISWLFPHSENQIRDKSVAWIYERISAALYELNNFYFNFDLYGFSEPLQFTEYNAPNGNYKYHIDTIENYHVRKLSMVIQLTDPAEYEGGELEIKTDETPKQMNKRQGSIIVFPSYILHRVNTVTKGRRNSLVGWISGPQFK